MARMTLWKNVRRWRVAAMCAVMLVALTGAVAPYPQGFSCAETARAALVDMRECSVRARKLKVNCIKPPSPPVSQFISNIKMTLLTDPAPIRVPNSTNILVCLGQDEHAWTYGSTRINMLFSHSIIPGVALMDESCLHRNISTDCTRLVRLRKEVFELSTLTFVPEDIRFWNFSSPLFGPHYAWFNTFIMFKRYQDAKPSNAVKALTGTGVTRVIMQGERFSQIYEIPPFQNLSSLNYLELYDNMNFGRRETFSGVPNLRFMTLRNSTISAIPSNIRNIKHLKLLSLIANNIHNVSEELVHYETLQELALDMNPLGPDLPHFPKMADLWMLSLSACGITTISAHAFQHLPRLIKLNLSKNMFINLDPLAFASLPNLDRLSMAQCGFTEWPKQSLKDLRLSGLYLNGNSFWTMNNLGEVGISVRYLQISKNKIGEWDDPQIFSCREEQQIQDTLTSVEEINDISNFLDNRTACYNGSWLLELQIEDNLIRTLSPNMRKSFDVVNKVHLSGNPIDCADCGTPDVQNWLHTTPTHFSDPPLCVDPAWDKGTPVQKLKFNNMPCLEPLRKMLMNIVVPVLVVTSVLSASGATVYLWRTEIAYLFHLLRVRRNKRRPDAEVQNNQYDAFVCYSGKNRKWVLRRLARLLERPPERYRVCLFDRDFRLGTHIVSNIVDAIDQSTKVIVVLTQHFIDSKWCQWELDMANHKMFSEDPQFLVLLELEPLERQSLPRLLRFLLDTRPVVRWPQPETTSTVLEAIAQLSGALGPSLHQRVTASQDQDQTETQEQAQAQAQAQPSCSTADERTPLLAAETAARF